MKVRSREKPLPILWDQMPSAAYLSSLDAKLQKVLLRVWPGKVTVVLPVTNSLQQWLNAELTEESVGVRISDHPGVIQASQILKGAIASTSANLSGEVETYRISDIPTEITSVVDEIIDMGELPFSPPSTVLDLRVFPPTVLRSGAVSAQEIDRIIAESL